MLRVIISKELKRVFTDRRLVFSAFLLPALSIYLIYSLMGNMIGDMSEKLDQHVSKVAIVKAPDSFLEFAKNFEDRYSFEFYDQNESGIKDRIESGDLDVMVVFDEGFDQGVEKYEAGGHPNINTFFNPGEEYSSKAINKVEYELLSGYQNTLLSNRFNGLDTLTAFTINVGNEDNKIAKEGKEAGLGMSFILPMLMNIMLFAGAMGIGIDVIAGEKERGTMAAMLLTPINRETIAFGKLISLGLVAFISALCTFGAILLSMPNASDILAAGNEVSLEAFAFTPLDGIMLLVILIMQVGIFVGAICLVSVMARSVKEAGTYVSPIYMLVMIAAFATIFTTGDVDLYKFAIPVLGNVFAIKELFLMELSTVEFAVTTGVSLVVVLVLVRLMTTAFNNEKIMFNS